MELLFETQTAKYLREVLYAAISQEETSETIVPDSYPDVERILDSFASVVIRGKDYRSGGVNVSGGIHAGVLYMPEDHSAPRTLHFYIPFNVKADSDEATDHTRAMVDCHVRSVDARAINSRKVMIRVNLAGHVAGYEPAEQNLYSYQPQPGCDLQTKVTTYRVIRPLELGEKPFTMAEEAELPSGRAPMQELCRYQTDLEVTEARMVGNKGVFKGAVNLKLLYLTEDGELNTWSCQLPFSQYVELEHDYDEEELQTMMVLTDLNVEDANGQGKRLLVNLQLLAQCAVVGERSMEVVEDAYSLCHDFTPRWQTLEAAGRLDRQSLNQVVRSAVQVPARSVVDTQIYLDTPVLRHQDDTATMVLPLTANILYVDEEGELQGTCARLESTCQTALADGCTCRPCARLTGEAFAVPAGEGVEVRCSVGFTVDSMAHQGMNTLCGGQMSEECTAAADRPSVILRPAKADDTLWSVAKGCRTTTDAICKANGLDADNPKLTGMLLIPITK